MKLPEITFSQLHKKKKKNTFARSRFSLFIAAIKTYFSFIAASLCNVFL